jgi:hypothetical protein
MLTITHTAANGTLIDGTERGDGTAPILKACGFRWSRNLGAWFVPRSRDQVAKGHVIDRAADQLRTAGHEVEVNIDNTRRPVEVVEAAIAERASERAGALEDKAARAAAKAGDAQDRSQVALDRLPDNGQPILIGHHSEGPHRRAIARADNAMRASIDADDAAKEAARRAVVAGRSVAARNNPVTVANRIERLEAEQRRAIRQRDGYSRTIAKRLGYEHITEPATGDYRASLESEIASLTEEIAWWKTVRDQQIAEGRIAAYGPETVTAGDKVKIRGQWYQVVRANRKTVTVPSQFWSGTETSPWHEVSDHHRPDVVAH